MFLEDQARQLRMSRYKQSVGSLDDALDFGLSVLEDLSEDSAGPLIVAFMSGDSKRIYEIIVDVGADNAKQEIAMSDLDDATKQTLIAAFDTLIVEALKGNAPWPRFRQMALTKGLGFARGQVVEQFGEKGGKIFDVVVRQSLLEGPLNTAEVMLVYEQCTMDPKTLCVEEIFGPRGVQAVERILNSSGVVRERCDATNLRSCIGQRMQRELERSLEQQRLAQEAIARRQKEIADQKSKEVARLALQRLEDYKRGSGRAITSAQDYIAKMKQISETPVFVQEAGGMVATPANVGKLSTTAKIALAVAGISLVGGVGFYFYKSRS